MFAFVGRSLASVVVALLVAGCSAQAVAPPRVGAAFVPQGHVGVPGLRPQFAFSCDPNAFRHKTVLTIKVGHTYDLPRFTTTPEWTLYPITGFCGVENSFLSRKDLVVDNYVSNHGYVVTPKIHATANVRWAEHPDIAVWEEAWLANIFRSPQEDVHLTLVRVVP